MIVNRKFARVATAVFSLAALFAFASVLSGCGDEDTQKGATPEDYIAGSTDGTVSAEPPPIQVLTGSDTGVRVDKPTAVVVHSNTELKKLIKEHKKGGDSAVLPGTDFKTRQIVGAFLPKQKAGTQLVISSVQQDSKNDTIIVKAAVLKPGKGCDTKGYPPYPYQIVDTRKMSGEPKLVLESGSQSGC